MAKIKRIEIQMVDLKPNVKRVDAIQSLVSQETPIVRVFDSDGAVGAGYSYTIGWGGPSIFELIANTLAPALIGRDPAQIEKIWKDLLFLTHATSVGAITSLALAALDTALWDLRCLKANLPLHLMAGGAQDKIRLHTPKAVGCTSTKARWSKTRCGRKRVGSPARSSRSVCRSMRMSTDCSGEDEGRTGIRNLCTWTTRSPHLAGVGVEER